jgi:PEGA domain/Protein of unknown function (DUF2846)
MRTICCLLLAMATGASGVTAAQPADERGVVYVWATWHVSTLGRATSDVFLDEKPIARLDRASYFIAMVPPGKHLFRTKTREAGAVALTIEPGRTYYLRLDTTSGLAVGHPVLTLVGSEDEGRAAIAQAKPLRPDDIKDRAIVLSTYGTAPGGTVPANTSGGPERVGKVSIQITSEPDGSEIFIDGRFVGSTPSREMVSEGEHTLKVTRPGFDGWERVVTVVPGSAKTFNAILTKQDK